MPYSLNLKRLRIFIWNLNLVIQTLDVSSLGIVVYNCLPNFRKDILDVEYNFFLLFESNSRF